MTLLIAVLAVSGCAKRDPSLAAGVPFDPYEAENRETHAFNREFDTKIFRPIAMGYSTFMPDDIETMLGRFSDNMSLPGSVVNNVLQGNMRGATEDTYRFVVNATLGLGGLFDTATELGMPAATDNDFGKTLHVWGVRQGAYVELPVLGPSTERDTVGLFVDFFTNPLSYIIEAPESYYDTGASVSARLTDRTRFSGTIDQILYESADSYAQSRSLYLQNRRFELGDDNGSAYLDPYDESSAPAEE